MASFVGLLSNAADGLLKVLDVLHSAGWVDVASVASTSANVDGTYRVLKSASGACHLLLHIRNVPTANNKYIVVQCFETWVTAGSKLQHWVPSTTQSADASGRLSLAAITCDEAFLSTKYVATASLACGPTGSQYQLVVVAGPEHLICASEQNGGALLKRSFYAGAYKPYLWNTNPGSFVLVNGLQRAAAPLSYPPAPPSSAGSPPLETHGAALTREYWSGAWKAATGEKNFAGSWVPLKAALGGTSSAPQYTMDGFDTTRIMALEILIYKRSTTPSATILREVLLGTYLDLVDLDGADAAKIGNSVEVGGTTYYNVSAEGTVFAKA